MASSAAKRAALVVIAQKGFQDVELAGTEKGLAKAGFNITLASKERGKCVGKFDGVKEASLALRDVNVETFDRVAFIGGPGASNYVTDADALAVARNFAAANKVVGAICIAPIILSAAGVLKDKNATTWTDGKKAEVGILRKGGAVYVDEPVVVDGRIVTGNGPNAADEFGEAFANCA
jgi:protease I